MSVMDMKAEMGSSRKAMIRSGISFNKLPNEQKQKDTSTNGRQKNEFAGTAKKRTERTRWPHVPWLQLKRRIVFLTPMRMPILSLEELLLWQSLRKV